MNDIIIKGKHGQAANAPMGGSYDNKMIDADLADLRYMLGDLVEVELYRAEREKELVDIMKGLKDVISGQNNQC